MERSLSSGSLPSVDSGISHDQPDVLLVCNICLAAPAASLVTTYCGHIFCWPCLYQWLRGLDQAKPCPVCRTMLRCNVNIVPIYGINEMAGSGTVMSIPPRPNPPRTPNPASARLTLESSSPFPTQSEVLAALDVLLTVSQRLQNDQIVVCNAQRDRLEALNLELVQMQTVGQRAIEQSLPEEVELLAPMQELIGRSDDALHEAQRARHLLDERRIMSERIIVRMRRMVVQADRELPSWWTSSGIEFDTAPLPVSFV